MHVVRVCSKVSSVLRKFIGFVLVSRGPGYEKEILQLQKQLPHLPLHTDLRCISLRRQLTKAVFPLPTSPTTIVSLPRGMARFMFFSAIAASLLSPQANVASFSSYTVGLSMAGGLQRESRV